MFSRDLVIVLAQRSWQAFAGFFTTIIIAKFLSPSEQGWYYTFISVAALYVFFELGVSSAIAQIASRMFIDLSWDDLKFKDGKEQKKFFSFFLASVRYYLVIAFLFFFVVSFAGYQFFLRSASSINGSDGWVLPWICLILITAINLITLPVMSIVEGSGEVSEVYSLRLMQGILGSILCWLVLICGGGIWCTIMLPLSSVIVFLIWIIKTKVGLLRMFRTPFLSKEFNWSKEVLSFQWRVGLSWISVYSMSQLVVPIVFFFMTPEVAGQIGLSLALAHMTGILSSSWITRHLPMMSKAVGNKHWQLFDETFKRNLLYSLIFYFLLSTVLLIFYQLIFATSYGARLLVPNLFIYLLIFVFFYHISNSFAAHLRCHKKEPLVWLFLFGAIMSIFVVVYASKLQSINWVIYSICLVQVFMIAPGSYFLWKRNNNKWRFS
jgi:O-antigen/teichoic acid export membrane protein